jgi:hypothetical protein
MVRLISIVAGIALIVFGLIVLPMPVPLGAIMIVMGLVLLVSSSTTVAGLVKSFRARYRSANLVIQKVEDHLPERWRKALQRSDP